MRLFIQGIVVALCIGATVCVVLVTYWVYEIKSSVDGVVDTLETLVTPGELADNLTDQVQEIQLPLPDPTTQETSEPLPDRHTQTVGSTNICNRTPEVQQALIAQLGILSCQLITPEELYRVQRFRIIAESVKAVDFADMPNLRHLKVQASQLEQGTFVSLDLESLTLALGSKGFRLTQKHLEGLESLPHLKLDGKYGVGPSAFDTLVALEYLSIGHSGDGVQGLHSRSFESLPNLKKLSGYVNPLDEIHFANLEVACYAGGNFLQSEEKRVFVEGQLIELLEAKNNGDGSRSCRFIVDNQVRQVGLAAQNQ